MRLFGFRPQSSGTLFCNKSVLFRSLLSIYGLRLGLPLTSAITEQSLCLAQLSLQNYATVLSSSDACFRVKFRPNIPRFPRRRPPNINSPSPSPLPTSIPPSLHASGVFRQRFPPARKCRLQVCGLDSVSRCWGARSLARCFSGALLLWRAACPARCLSGALLLWSAACLARYVSGALCGWRAASLARCVSASPARCSSGAVLLWRRRPAARRIQLHPGRVRSGGALGFSQGGTAWYWRRQSR